MRRKSIIVLAMTVSLMAVSGCDFLRSVAGRPTSAYLSEKREEIRLEQERLRQQAVRDSIAAVRADSLAALDARDARILDSLGKKPGRFLRPLKLGGLSRGAVLDHKYYIVTASFKSEDNARKKVHKCEESGIPAVVIPFRSGMNAVGVCPGDRISIVLADMEDLRARGLCPKEGWILVNE